MHRACVILGGIERAAAHFAIPAEHLQPMMEGRSPVPEPLFLAALEVLLLHLAGGAPQ